MTFKIGDVVILKSGGMPMTVHDIGDYSDSGLPTGVNCIWFDNAKKLGDVFHPDTLEHYRSQGTGGLTSDYDPLEQT